MFLIFFYPIKVLGFDNVDHRPLPSQQLSSSDHQSQKYLDNYNKPSENQKFRLAFKRKNF